MKENFDYYNYLIEEVVNDIMNLGVNYESDASQFRNTKNYNEWFCAFTSETEDFDVTNETLCESIIENSSYEEIKVFEEFLNDIVKCLSECDTTTISEEELVEKCCKKIKEKCNIIVDDTIKVDDADTTNKANKKEEVVDPEGEDSIKVESYDYDFENDEEDYDDDFEEPEDGEDIDVDDDEEYYGDGFVQICLTDEDADFDLVRSLIDEFGLDAEFEEDEDGEYVVINSTFETLGEFFDRLDAESDFDADSDIEDTILTEVQLCEVKRNRKINKGRKRALRKRGNRQGKDGQIWDAKRKIYRKRTASEIRKARKKARFMRRYMKKYHPLNNSCNENYKYNSETTLLNNVENNLNEEKVMQNNSENMVVTSEMVSAIVEAAQLRSEAIVENMTAQFAGSDFFASLNESESDEVKGMIKDAVSKVLDESYEKIAMDTVEVANHYLTEEVIPSIVNVFSNDYTKEIVESINENVDEYLNYAAEEIVEELAEKNLITKSVRSSQLESFEQELMALIESKLQIIPEREDALVSANETISQLANKLEEASIEKKKTLKEMNENKRKLYVYENMPEELSESMKEKLVNYANDVLSEAETYKEFVSKFDEAVESALNMINETVVEEQTPVIGESVEEKETLKNDSVKSFNDFADILSSVVRLG